MKTLVFEAFEFDSYSSEESLEVNIASRDYGSVKQFRDVGEFVGACVDTEEGAQLGPAKPYDDQASFSSIRAYLKRFADIDVPRPCNWRTYILFVDDLEWDGVLETPELFIRYHWMSTA